MIYQLLFVMLLCIYCYYIIDTNIFLRKIILFYVLSYGLQIVLAIDDPYHYYSISPRTILFFNLQLLFFVIGVSLTCVKKKSLHNYNVSSIFDIKVNRQVLIIQTISLILAISRYQKINAYILSTGGYTDSVRGYFFRGLYKSYTEMFLNNLVSGFEIISYFLVFGILFFHHRSFSIKELYIVVVGIAVVVLNALSSLGRGTIFELLVAFTLFYFLSGSTVQDIYKKRIKPIAVALVSIVAVIIIVATMLRSNIDNANEVYGNMNDFVLKPFITYFYVPICAFEYGSEHIFDDLVPMFGAADFAGLIDLLMTPFRNVDHDIISINNILGEKMSSQFSFPSGELWNALFTGASNYYIDFGFLGFIVFPIIHGSLFVYLCNKSKRSGAWFVLLLFLFMASFTHMSRSGIQSMSTVFAMFWIWYTKKTKAIT